MEWLCILTSDHNQWTLSTQPGSFHSAELYGSPFAVYMLPRSGSVMKLVAYRMGNPINFHTAFLSSMSNATRQNVTGTQRRHRLQLFLNAAADDDDAPATDAAAAPAPSRRPLPPRNANQKPRVDGASVGPASQFLQQISAPDRPTDRGRRFTVTGCGSYSHSVDRN